MSNKQRLDVLLVELGLAESRERAKALIMAGIVYVDNQKFDKAGQTVNINQNIEVRGDSLKYVSRGGLKLEKAMDAFGINLNGKICMDVGASTGGFTDCMLQNGAETVYCVDVGYGQLAWKLRSDPRVVSMERTNIRYVTREAIKHDLDFVTVDASFISLKLILPVVSSLMKNGAEAVALIKPQFEAGRDKVGKKGVVRDKAVHLEVVNKILEFSKQIGLCPVNLTFSPIRGPEGNIEYLVHLIKGEGDNVSEQFAVDVVESSHGMLV